MCEIWHCQLAASRTLVVRRPDRAVARRVRRSSTMLRGEIPADAPGDPRGGVLDGIPRQVRVAGGRLHLGMAQQLPDHREALAQGERPRSIRVPKAVQVRGGRQEKPGTVATEYRPQCSGRSAPPSHESSCAPDGRSAPSSRYRCGRAACQSLAGSRRAPARGTRRSGEDHQSGLDWRDMRTNAVADPRSRRLHGFVRQVRVASGCLNLSVTEELADHGKALAKGQRPGRK